MANTTRRSPIALAVLALLHEEPMHPYRMQYLIKHRGKEEVINVRQRASLYQTIDRLTRAGLIRIRGTERESSRPERTIYELSDEGRKTLDRWLRQMLSTPATEFREFPAALAFLPLLPPAEALDHLERRLALLEEEFERLDGALRSVQDRLPRLFLLEEEYKRSQVQAELTWVREIAGELREGHITWSEEWLREIALHLEAEERRSDMGRKGEQP